MPFSPASAQLIDGPLAAPVLPLVCLGWPVEPNERDKPGLVICGSVNKLEYIMRIEAHLRWIAIIVDYISLHNGVGDGFKADHAQPDEQDPNVFQG